MPSPLENALAELGKIGAKGVPSRSMIEKAPNGKRWAGDLPPKPTHKEFWELIKHSSTSFHVGTSGPKPLNY